MTVAHSRHPERMIPHLGNDHSVPPLDQPEVGYCAPTRPAAGRFHAFLSHQGSSECFDGWCLVAQEVSIARRVSALLDGRLETNGVTLQVSLARRELRVVFMGAHSVERELRVHGVPRHRSAEGLAGNSASLEAAGQEEEGVSVALGGPRAVSRRGRGVYPYVSLLFWLESEPGLGGFEYVSTSWALVAASQRLALRLAAQDGETRATLEIVMEDHVCRTVAITFE